MRKIVRIKAAQGFSVPAKRDRKATSLYAAAGNPRRTQIRAKGPFMDGS